MTTTTRVNTRTTHRAVVRADGTVTVLDRPTPVPDEHELLLAPVYAGLCGTDIQMLRGLRSDPSPVIGHEGVARVVAAGGGVPEHLAPGTLVCVNPTHPGDPSFLLGHNVDGLLQERVLIAASAVRDGLVLPLPAANSTENAALLEPLAVVHYALGLLAGHRPHTLVVFGDGVVGHLAVRAAPVLLGAGTRIVHLHHTEQGVDWSEDHPTPGVQRALNDAAGARLLAELPADERVAVLLATPRDATLACLDTALRTLRGDLAVDLLGGLPPGAASPLLPGTDLVRIRAANCAGVPDPALRFTAPTDTGATVSLFGHRGVANGHLATAAAELVAHPRRYRDLVTHLVDVDEAAEVMRGLARSRDRTVAGRRLIKLAVRFAPRDDAGGGAG
ncbi:alcohol dehydrogenase catalytic domain-containing protein [Saccharothrix deserti]|uniref:alcohol dehydrogenase catalytic domain-containing protein n=1 Tax=Saccharothrix deserti TaxID=2593674 RepID=UPI00131BB8C5|nr:alcohol dehydrogenase catalytic domain-containing protein [Saccharothrix deserti]